MITSQFQYTTLPAARCCRSAYELRRHPETARLTWLAAFVHLRGRALIDDLVDLLIETVHHIGARA